MEFHGVRLFKEDQNPMEIHGTRFIKEAQKPMEIHGARLIKEAQNIYVATTGAHPPEFQLPPPFRNRRVGAP